LSKKRFTQGFDLFFGGQEPSEDAFAVQEPIVEIKVKPKKKTKTPSSNKKFADGLESLFMDIMEEKTQDKPQPKRKSKSFVGLDQLIRSTIDVSQLTSTDKETKRLTILLEIDKIEKLRAIAKTEKVRLKNIIRQIVAAYLEEFDNLEK